MPQVKRSGEHVEEWSEDTWQQKQFVAETGGFLVGDEVAIG